MSTLFIVFSPSCLKKPGPCPEERQELHPMFIIGVSETRVRGRPIQKRLDEFRLMRSRVALEKPQGSQLGKLGGMQARQREG